MHQRHVSALEIPPEQGPGLYVLRNIICWPGMVKVGMSAQGLGPRVAGLINSTELPYPSELVALFPTRSKVAANAAENEVHRQLKEGRATPSREFFYVSPGPETVWLLDLISGVVDQVSAEYAANDNDGDDFAFTAPYVGKTIEQMVDEADAMVEHIRQLRPQHRGRSSEPLSPEALSAYPELGSKNSRIRGSRFIAAKRAGFGNEQTYRTAKAVVDAARGEPGRYSHLLAEMNRTGRVDRAFRLVTLIERSG